MTDLVALLAAIKAQPSEDTPRLLYADKLDDLAGEETARSAFIRTQIEIAAMAPPTMKPLRWASEIPYSVHGRTAEITIAGVETQRIGTVVDIRGNGHTIDGAVVTDLAPTRPIDGEPCMLVKIRYGPDAFKDREKLNWLREREKEILRASLSEWVPWVNATWDWQRGFVEGVEIQAGDWLGHGDKIAKDHPVRQVTINGLTTFISGEQINLDSESFLRHAREEYPDITFTLRDWLPAIEAALPRIRTTPREWRARRAPV